MKYITLKTALKHTVKSSESPINNVRWCTAHLGQEINLKSMHNVHEKTIKILESF